MKYNAKKLLKKIDDYFAGVISKRSLGEWANSAYYDLLKGGYIENEKIVIYPFLKVIATFHLKEDEMNDNYPCTEQDVKMIQDILRGKRNLDFAVEMSVPIQAYSMFKENPYFDEERRKFFSELQDMFMCYFEQGGMLSDEMVLQIRSAMSVKHENKVILSSLEEAIIRFLKFYLESDSAEQGLQKNLKLYAQKSKQDIIAERLMSYLDCYIGKRNFQLLITYEAGKPDIFIAV
ncbi:MAG: hypothetical protein NC517_12940 [Firmicutes bacterium]|nr:hypothetical protein [Bacillota bacterium]